MMRRFAIMCMLATFASTTMFTAHADTGDKQKVLKTALSFGNSVHCEGTPFHENNPLNSVFKIGDDEFAEYAVLQYVDWHCSGGNGSGLYILTPIQPSTANRFVVNTSDYPDGDMLESLGINGKFIENASYDTLRKNLTLVYAEYDDDGGNSQATLKYRTTINLANKRVINKQFLGKQR